MHDKTCRQHSMGRREPRQGSPRGGRPAPRAAPSARSSPDATASSTGGGRPAPRAATTCPQPHRRDSVKPTHGGRKRRAEHQHTPLRRCTTKRAGGTQMVDATASRAAPNVPAAPPTRAAPHVLAPATDGGRASVAEPAEDAPASRAATNARSSAPRKPVRSKHPRPTAARRLRPCTRSRAMSLRSRPKATMQARSLAAARRLRPCSKSRATNLTRGSHARSHWRPMPTQIYIFIKIKI